MKMAASSVVSFWFFPGFTLFLGFSSFFGAKYGLQLLTSGETLASPSAQLVELLLL